MQNSTSEVAALRQRIAQECEAGWWALHGLAAGVAQHDFIHARFQSMENYHFLLTEMVGEEQATEILCDVYNQTAGEQ